MKKAAVFVVAFLVASSVLLAITGSEVVTGLGGLIIGVLAVNLFFPDKTSGDDRQPPYQ